MLKWPEVQKHPPSIHRNQRRQIAAILVIWGLQFLPIGLAYFPKTEIHSQKLSRTVQHSPISSLATADTPPKSVQPCFRTEFLSWTNSQRHQNDKDPSCLDHQCWGQPSVSISIAASDLHRSTQFSMQLSSSSDEDSWKNMTAPLSLQGSEVSGLSGCAGLWFSHSFSRVLIMCHTSALSGLLRHLRSLNLDLDPGI